jgi:uncharacterized membrane protein YkvA (DUF1232 family)
MSDREPVEPGTKKSGDSWSFVSTWRERARRLKLETYALYLAYRDPRTPWYARLFAACVVAYAFSPIDLIPDFIPVLGYVDDLILVPVGIGIALKLIPPQVMSDSREIAQAQADQQRPTNWLAGLVVVAVWLGLLVITVVVLASAFT